ncbi:DNA primase [Candidatus Falkowbacteria bacterium]|nr:DNA primase [Candidatus Falkowbacteria bacterium]
MNPSDEVKAKLDLVDVIRGYIDLKPAGVNFRANCPFHREKSPSFIVSPDKQIWHCFGCGKGGDLFTFVMDIEGLSFIETLRLLAPKAGVELKQADPKLASQRSRSLDAMELATKYYHHILTTSKQAQPARDYLAQRGLSEETISEWRIGYSPDSWDDLVNFLGSRGFTPNEIFAAGLSTKKEGANRFYNRFRGRIMFPIADANGDVVAFTARVSPEKEATEKMGKYINSPQTSIYDKSKILFGLNRAKQAIRQENAAVLVEGQMDVITAHQHGFKNVIATSGTALTADQLDMIKRYTTNISLALDADSAGQEAIQRGEQMARSIDYQEMEAEDARGRLRRYVDPEQSYTFHLKVVEIPNGKDPDDCIRNNPEEWRQAVASGKQVMEFYFDKALATLDVRNIEHRRAALKVLLPKLVELGRENRSEQDFWLKRLSQRLDISETALREDLAAAEAQFRPQNNPRPRPKEAAPLAPKSRGEQLSELLLALALRQPNYFSYLANNLQLDQVIGSANQGLYKGLIIYYNKNTETWLSGTLAEDIGDGQNRPQNAPESNQFSYQIIREWLNLPEAAHALLADQPAIDRIKRKLDELTLLGEKEFFQLELEEARAEIIRLTAWLKKQYLQSRLKDVSQLIKQVEAENNLSRLQPLLEEFKFLSEELKEFNHIN